MERRVKSNLQGTLIFKFDSRELGYFKVFFSLADFSPVELFEGNFVGRRTSYVILISGEHAKGERKGLEIRTPEMDGVKPNIMNFHNAVIKAVLSALEEV